MVEVVISIAAKVAEVLVVPIGKQICYPFKYNTNMEELKKQVQKLTDRRDMVQCSVDEAQRQGEQIDKFVEGWMKSVDEFAEKVVKPIIDEQDKAGKLCSIGFCSNLMTRYFLSKKAVKAAKDGISLLGEGTCQKVSYRPAIRRTKSVYIRGYEAFDSRMPVFEKLMEALTDEDVNSIGVWGMGGVGKTTLVKRVAAQAIEDKLFDVVVMAEVTQTPNIHSLQGDIADELGLKLDKEGLPGRAAQLRERLKNETSILLILDNLWEKLDLDAVGIPFWSDEEPGVTQEVDQGGRNAKKRKWRLLLTSRDLDLLRNDMKTQKNLKIDTLSTAETENLFWKIVNHSKEEANFKDIAIEIVRKCAGLPIAITTIANALKNKDLSYWNNALGWLKMSNPRPIKGMEASVYATIELSYNSLGSEEQSLFLFFSLFSASGWDLSMSRLLKHCLGLGLFKDINTMEEARDRMHTLVGNLKASSLLLDSNAKGCFKWHDIIHDVAYSIASSKDKLMFTIRNVGSLKERMDENLPISVLVSVPFFDITELPERLEFPKLKFLYLFNDKVSSRIPDAFFDGMKELKVLDLRRIDLLAVPSSLCLLTNLQTLIFNNCRIRDIAILGKLKALEILSFLDSEIEQIPGEIRQLTRLRLLDLNNCSKLELITPNVLSCLTRLEELYMGNSFVQWDVEGQSNASLAELKKLSNLTTLELHVLKAQIIPHDLFFRKLERYKIFIGDLVVWRWSNDFETILPKDFETSRILKLKLDNSLYLSDGIKFLINKVEDLSLDEPKNALQELHGEGFQQLKRLHVQNAPQIQYIINSVGWGLCNVFPHKLESLVLHNLVNLEKIYHGQLTVESFSQLKVIKVGQCDKLKHLTLPMPGNFLQLREIEVTHCNKLEEIVFVESRQVHTSEQTNKIEFTQLRNITLQCLPLLTRFGFNAPTSNMGFQEIVAGDDLESSISFFSQNVLLPSLNELVLESLNCEVIWNKQFLATSSHLHNLTSLIIDDLCNLKFLFSSSMVKSLVRLKHLEINYCKLMELVVVTEGERPSEVLFPSLLTLNLHDLPKLTRFCDYTGILDLSSLLQLWIEWCPNMETFVCNSICANLTASVECSGMNLKENLQANIIQPFFDEKVRLSSLKELTIKQMDNIRKLWHNQLYSDSFCKLELFNVSYCNKLFNVFPSNMLGRLQKLDGLVVEKCDSVEEIFELEAHDRKKTHGIVAAQLKTLWLHNLPKLKHVWNMDSQVILSSHNLHLLSVGYCDSLKSLFPAIIARGLEQLEKLCVRNCMMEEIIAKQDEVEAVPELVFPKLTKLELFDLPRLKSFHSGLYISKWPMLESLVVRRCNAVEMLASEFQSHGESQHDIPSGQPLFLVDKVLECHNIGSLVSFPISFRNLTTLKVSNCDELLNLVASSTAKGLVKLNIIEITKCKKIEEIIAHKEDEAEDCIIFNQLKYLELNDLPSLTIFSSGSCTIEFPSLQEVAVRQCPNMKIFSRGDLSTPRLHTLQIGESEGCWEGDLNTSIAQQNIEKNDRFLKED